MDTVNACLRRTRRSLSAAAAVAGVVWLPLPPIAIAQTQPQTQTGPRAQQPSRESPSSAANVSDRQLDETAKAVRQVNAVKETYIRKLATAPSSDKPRIAGEANGALVKAVTDQGLSVDEYNAILTRAQTDATLRQKLVERISTSTQ